MEEKTNIEKFTINVSDAVLDDLAHRLAATRWPDEMKNANWDYGTNLAYMKDIVNYWQKEYSWRKQEAAINKLPQYRITLDGMNIHFIHQRGKGPKPLPLIMSHGWPGSFLEFKKILPLLTDPEAHGGSAEDAFDVIIPSLPGFGFSDHSREPGMNPNQIAELWGKLMTELGYERFGVQGGDWGSVISTAIGLDIPDRIIGVHLNYIAGHFLLGGSLDQPQDEPDAKHWVAELKDWFDNEGSYYQQQSTKPQTLSFGLNDSPVGLAAWIIEKFRTWSDGGLEGILTYDELLNNLMTYWVTESANSSAQIYYEVREKPLSLSPENRVTPPVGVALFPKEIPQPPRSVAERGYNITHWTKMDKGGHFAAMEQPELLAQDIRDFFRSYR